MIGGASRQRITFNFRHMLYLNGTPIGNLDDLSIRAARTLLEADIILAEDTRSVQTLLKRAREIMINDQFSISETPSAPPHKWGGDTFPKEGSPFPRNGILLRRKPFDTPTIVL